MRTTIYFFRSDVFIISRTFCHTGREYYAATYFMYFFRTRLIFSPFLPRILIERERESETETYDVTNAAPDVLQSFFCCPVLLKILCF